MMLTGKTKILGVKPTAALFRPPQMEWNGCFRGETPSANRLNVKSRILSSVV
jgi:hypothetical protein